MPNLTCNKSNIEGVHCVRHMLISNNVTLQLKKIEKENKTKPDVNKKGENDQRRNNGNREQKNNSKSRKPITVFKRQTKLTGSNLTTSIQYSIGSSAQSNWEIKIN